MASTPLDFAADVGLRLADPERPELGWRSREHPLTIESAIPLYGVLLRLEGEIALDSTVRALVKIRASQINRCAPCVELHWADARAAGESEERLSSLATWRERPLYSQRERAALALCEAITLISDAGISDDVWGRAVDWFRPDELAHLVFAITAINSWNRLTIAGRIEPPPG